MSHKKILLFPGVHTRTSQAFPRARPPGYAGMHTLNPFGRDFQTSNILP